MLPLNGWGFFVWLALAGFMIWAYKTGRLRQWAEAVGDWIVSHLPLP